MHETELARRLLEIVLAKTRESGARRVLAVRGFLAETERLERCPNAHTYYDPRTDQVRNVPVCAWRVHMQEILRDIQDYYSAGGPEQRDWTEAPGADRCVPVGDTP